MNKIKTLLLICGIFCSLAGSAATYYVCPYGNNNNSGTEKNASGAWRTIDRGQPAFLIENIKDGQKEIKLSRAIQFPKSGTVRIGNNKIRYTSRNFYTLKGCSGAKASRRGSRIHSVDWQLPKAGDTVIVTKGVYIAKSGWPKMRGLYRGAVVFTSGGTKDRPVIYSGEKGAIIDGRLLEDAVYFSAAHGIVLEGFNIRRGRLILFQSSYCVIKNNIMHEGRGGIHVRYSHDIEIAYNKIYDYRGAWTEPGIFAGAGQRYYIHHNTIAETSRPAIVISDKAGEDFQIKNNIITRCRSGIEIGKKATLKPENIKNNCLWNVGKVQWLSQVETGKAGRKFYKNFKFVPADIHVDPEIISFDVDSPYFMDIAQDSLCAQKKIGAGKAIPFPQDKAKGGLNLLANSGFENGWYSWKGSAWQPFKPGQAGWGIVDDPKQDKNKCAMVFHYPFKGDIQPCIRSKYVKIDRGHPITLSFRGRGTGEKHGHATVAAALGVPSWHEGSSSWKKNFKLTDKWQTFKATFIPKAFYPDQVFVKFTVRNHAKAWIDDVKLISGTNKTVSQNIKLALEKTPYGLLFPPNKKILFKIKNKMKKEKNVTAVYSFSTPNGIHGKAINNNLTLGTGKTVTLAVKPPTGLRGAALLNIKIIADNKVCANEQIRIVLGYPVPKGRNRHFYGVNPLPSLHSPESREVTARQYRAAAALGIGIWHEYLDIPKMKKLYTEKDLEMMINEGRKAGIEWLITLSDHKFFTGKRTKIPGPDDLDGMESGEITVSPASKNKRVTAEQLKIWGRWVKALVTKYKGRVKYWEVLNEPNCFLNGDEYLSILKTTSRAIRKADPKAIIIGGSVVNAYRKSVWNKTIFQGKDYFDQFSYHPYRFGLRNPYYGGFAKGLKMALDDLRKAGSKAKIHFTEEYRDFGPDMTDYSNETEKREANCLARIFNRSLGEGCAAYNRHHMLFRDSEMSPNLGMVAIHTMASLLNPAKTIGKVKVSSDYDVYLYQVSNPKADWKLASGITKPCIIAAIWSKDTDYSFPLKLNFDSSTIKAVNVYGNSIPTVNGNVVLGRDLIYVIFPQMTPYQVKKKIKKAFKTIK